jgi:class 3 adenylate cyclase
MSIFSRLFLMLALLSALPLAGAALLLWGNAAALERRLHTQNKQVGTHVSSRGTEILTENLQATHLRIVREKGKKVETFFQAIHKTILLESKLIGQFLADSGSADDAPPLLTAEEVARRTETDAAFRTTYRGIKPYSMYHLAPGVERAKVAQPLNRLRRLGTFFAHAYQSIPGCSSSYLGHRDGFIFGYPGGDRFPADYDPRKRPFYQEAIAHQPQVWIGIYPDKRGVNVYLTCSRAVFTSGDKDPVAVAAIDIKLNQVLAELFAVSDLKVSRAILLDEQGRVRVSADYQKAAVEFDSQTILHPPPVEELHDPGFNRVAKEIRANPGPEAGVIWAGREGAEAGNLFVYTRVYLGATPDPQVPPARAASGTTWYYIVKLPLGPLLQPIHDVGEEVEEATRGIEAAIAAETRKSTWMILIATVGALLAAFVLAYVGARATARPLVEMAGVARAIGDGNLDQKVTVTSQDEVGQLGTAINGMIEGLKERDFIKGTFKRYVAAAVVDRLLVDRKISLGGVKRKVTVFFSDLMDFTTLAEQLPPEVLVGVLNEYLSVMTDTLLANEGTLDKYIGDAILAFWGDPIAHDDDAVRACRTALEHQRRFQQFQVHWQERGLPHLELRIGMQTGTVIVGNIGSSTQMNYTVLGDTVNLASRLESANKYYGTRILIGEETRREAGDAIEVREMDLLAVKGKHQVVRVYELLGLAGESSSERARGWREYESGLAAYRERRWDDAEAALRRAQAILGDDPPSAILLERVAGYRLHPPPEPWDGSFAMAEK